LFPDVLLHGFFVIDDEHVEDLYLLNFNETQRKSKKSICSLFTPLSLHKENLKNKRAHTKKDNRSRILF